MGNAAKGADKREDGGTLRFAVPQGVREIHRITEDEDSYLRGSMMCCRTPKLGMGMSFCSKKMVVLFKDFSLLSISLLK